MSDDEEEFSDDEETPSYPWSKHRQIYLLMDYAAALQRATATYFESITEQTGADHNAKVDEATFRQEVSKQIETLPLFTEPKE